MTFDLDAERAQDEAARRGLGRLRQSFRSPGQPTQTTPEPTPVQRAIWNGNVVRVAVGRES